MKRNQYFLVVSVLLFVAFCSSVFGQEFSISYQLNGGKIPEGKVNPASFDSEAPSIKLVNPVKNGFIFTGWILNGNRDSLTCYALIEKGSSGDRTYSASWLAPVYTIEYDLAGGSLAEGKSNRGRYSAEIPSFTLNNPSREGYRFIGWVLDGSTQSASRNITLAQGSYGNRKYTALWEPIEHFMIAYSMNGGAVEKGKENPAEYSNDTPDFKLSNPKKTGFTFDGWVLNGDSSSISKDVLIKNGSTGDRKYSAAWTKITYSISYHDEDGRPLEGVDYPASYDIQTPDIELVNPERPGYRIRGWVCNSNLLGLKPSIAIPQGSTGNLEYYAIWEPIVYSIKYKGTDGKTGNPAKYNIETASFDLANPEKNGYEFMGWIRNDDKSSLNSKMSISQGSTGDLVFTASWKPLVYHLSYDEKGKMFKEKEPSEPLVEEAAPVENRKTYTIEDSFKLENPERAGYQFVGWIREGEEVWKADPDYRIALGSTGDRALVAVWNPIDYVLSYKLNGGEFEEGKANPPTFNCEMSPFELISPKRNYYDFVGWKASDGVTAGRIVDTSNLGDQAFEAIWKPSEYTITYDLDGGILPEGVENPASFSIEMVPVITDPEKAGYVFDGWKLMTPDPEAFDKDPFVDICIRALWKATQFSIEYDLDGGSFRYGAANPDSYTVETDSFQLVNPEKDNFVFLGWIREGSNVNSFENPLSIEKGTTGNKKYYALFESESVPVGLTAKRQSSLIVLGKDGIRRPDWVVKVPSEEGKHFEAGYANEGSFFDSYKAAQKECLKAIAEWKGVKVTIDSKSISFDQTAAEIADYLIVSCSDEYDASTALDKLCSIDSDQAQIQALETAVSGREIVEYWEDSSGGVWVLMSVPL